MMSPTNRVRPLLEELRRQLEVALNSRDTRRKIWKWVRRGTQSTRELVSVDEPEDALAAVVDGLRESAPFLSLAKLIHDDPVLAQGGFRAGSWGGPDNVIWVAIVGSMQGESQSWTFCVDKALAKFSEIRESFEKDRLTFQVQARLLGAHLEPAKFHPCPNADVRRLTDYEIYGGQAPLGPSESWSLLPSNVEIRASLVLPFPRDIEGGYWKAQEMADEQSAELFNDLRAALQLSQQGHFWLGPRSMTDALGGRATIGEPLGYSFTLARTSLADGEVKRWCEAYQTLQIAREHDPILSRAIGRFIFALHRVDPRDRLVDFVIGWEVLLLAIVGQQQESELSYRFSVNGANLLAITGVQPDRRKGFKLMKDAYAFRSFLVHGQSSASRLKKILGSAETDSSSSLMNELESGFRHVVRWLANVPADQRPYAKAGGWEELLWP